MMRRRELFALPLLPLFATVLSARAGQTAQSPFLSAVSDSEGGHWLQAFDLSEASVRPRYRLPLPGRGHDIALHPARDRFVAVARRPDDWLLVGALSSGRVLATLRAPAGRHFYGHGVFSADGSRFFTLENAYDDPGDSGRLTLWTWRDEARSLERQAEYPSYGVGPHELALMPDDRTLVVANGGMRTHPDSGREVLNLEEMQPSLSYIDSSDGRLLEQHRLEPRWHQSSIRHLDVSATGQVALVMQYQGLPFEAAPLVALHRRGEALRLPTVPDEALRQMKQYCGSVRFDHSGRYLAVSCPRGNLLTFWDAQEARYLGQRRGRDACGVCALDTGFLYTAGSTGRVAWYDPASESSAEIALPAGFEGFWDNHLRGLAGLAGLASLDSPGAWL